MSTSLTESVRVSDVLLMEEGEAFNYVRDQITLLSGAGSIVVGQVLGKIAVAGATETHVGNTGNGAMTLDVTTPVLANARAGVYTVRCTAAASNGGTFRVFDPVGDTLGDVVVAATFSDQIKFVIADGATDFIVGDTFLVTVAAGSGKYQKVTVAALDGSSAAAGVCVLAADATSADATSVAVVRGPAILKLNGLTWTAGMTSGQKTTALAQLAALGITVRSDFGS